MKQISVSKLKQMTATQIKDGGCFEVVADSEHVAFVIVGAISLMKDKIRVCASQIDASRGK